MLSTKNRTAIAVPTLIGRAVSSSPTVAGKTTWRRTAHPRAFSNRTARKYSSSIPLTASRTVTRL